MNSSAKQIVTAGLMLAIGLLLPIVFHFFALGGPMFLPMHIPVLLGGFFLSPFYALSVGAITPILSSILTGMPPIFPGAVQMTFELAAYGFVASYLYHNLKTPIFPTLLGAMLTGRAVAGVVNYILLTKFLAKAFTLKVFLTASFVTALPGILVQVVMIPLMVTLIEISVFREGEINEHN